MSDERMPRCPLCGGLLERVTIPAGSPLNPEQFDSVKAGDYVCRECPGDEGKSGWKYFWQHEIERPQEGVDFEQALKETMMSVVSQAKEELYAKSQSELEGYWFFKWDDALSVERNAYAFFDDLGLYGRSCRDWEEHHNGCVCVVERVRDKYLMPKITEFVARVLAQQQAEIERLRRRADVIGDAKARIAQLEAERDALKKLLSEVRELYATAQSALMTMLSGRELGTETINRLVMVHEDFEGDCCVISRIDAVLAAKEE